ncbi:NPL4-like protein [Dichanthelium oligosanthes]|uniref:NPL4-like protein n=1 Tax=Dichanthelium oligosanthes TaxID=888268 RepID=A0A1E5WEF4_9POAL|nr:NPL4-like protein [Dichanthelium oligosanthes]
MILRIRSRDGTDRITVPDPASATVADLQRLIESHLTVPVPLQRLSLDPALLLPSPSAAVPLLADPAARLASLRLANGAFVYLAYPPDARSARPPPPKVLSAAGSFGKKMTMDDLIARQIRVTRQENALCAAASFDRDAANAFQLYVAESLAFAVKRAGFLYGRVDAETKEVFVDFIYEPPQQGSEDVVHLMRDPDEEARVDAIAEGLGMHRVGLVFTQAVGRKASETGEYTMSNREVVQATQLQAEGGIPEWITAIVKLEVGDDGTGDVHFEAFQMSEICVKLFKDGVLETEVGETDDPRLSKMQKEVVAGGKDTMEVDNDFFLVPVKISDHQGPLLVGFPIENRGSPVGMSALKSHLDRTKHLTFVRRISDFHLLLKVATFLDVKADMPPLASCVKTQSRVPEGYQLLIESLANQG